MSEDTVFTKIIKREVPANIVYEDESYIAFLDIFPFVKGHTMVVPKKVYERVTDMPEEEYVQLQRVVHRVARNMKEVLGFNVGSLVYGEDVPHVHVHVFPLNSETSVLHMKGKVKYLDNEAQIYAKRLNMGVRE